MVILKTFSFILDHIPNKHDDIGLGGNDYAQVHPRYPCILRKYYVQLKRRWLDRGISCTVYV